MILLDAHYLGHILTTEIAVWGICIGAMLAFTVYFFQMRVLGSLVRALLDSAVGEENATTLTLIGKNNAFYRYFLRDNTPLRKIVSVVGDTLPKTAEGQGDFSLARFYIDPEREEIARKRYQRETKIWIYILGMLAFLLLGVALHFLLPLLMSLLPA